MTPPFAGPLPPDEEFIAGTDWSMFVPCPAGA